MQCPKCGREIPDGTVCPCAYEAPALSGNPAVNVLRASGSSPLFLIAVILLTLTPVLSVVTALTGGGVSLVKTLVESAAQANPNLYFQQSGTEESFRVLSIFTVFLSIPSLVLLIGMWMHYAACRNRRSVSLSTAGLTVCKVVVIFQLVLQCLVAAVYGFLMAFAVASSFGSAGNLYFNGQPSPFDSGAATALMVVMFAFLILFVLGFLSLGILYNVCIVKTINRMKATANFGVPDNRIPMYLIVVLYIVGGFMGLYSLLFLLLSLTFGLSLLTGAAAEILIAVCLGKYRKQMTLLLYPQMQPFYVPQLVLPVQGYPVQQGIQPPAAPAPAEAPVPVEIPGEKPEE